MPDLLAVPEDFQAEVERAKAQEKPRHQRGDLKLLQTEVRGFQWEIDGLRLVGRAQIFTQADDDARQTWEAVRAYEPNDKEANTWLAAISSPGNQTAPPPHVLLFTGHRIDSPARKKPRFPADKEAAARLAIKESVEKERARVAGQVIGIAGGASGGDILFHEVCAELNIPANLYLAMPRESYVQESVRDSGPAWVDRFDALYERLPRCQLGESKELPGWLQSKPDYSIWQRNNLWMLYHALALGSRYATLIALWDGSTGDGPGGTQDMVNQANESGANVIILPTRKIFGLE